MTILVVSSSPETHWFFGNVAKSLNWRIVSAYDLSGFVALFKTCTFAAVVCENNLDGNDWTDVLDYLNGREAPPLVVTSTRADEFLWVEVLHRGGYDVLAQPFDRMEVERVLGMCCSRPAVGELPVSQLPHRTAGRRVGTGPLSARSVRVS